MCSLAMATQTSCGRFILIKVYFFESVLFYLQAWQVYQKNSMSPPSAFMQRPASVLLRAFRLRAARAGSGEVPLMPAERSAERERRRAAQAAAGDPVSDCAGFAEWADVQA